MGSSEHGDTLSDKYSAVANEGEESEQMKQFKRKQKGNSKKTWAKNESNNCMQEFFRQHQILEQQRWERQQILQKEQLDRLKKMRLDKQDKIELQRREELAENERMHQDELRAEERKRNEDREAVPATTETGNGGNGERLKEKKNIQYY